MDHTKKKIVDKKLLDYLESDCRGLYEVIEKYRDQPLIKKAGVGFTTASQSLKIFRTMIDKPIRSLSQDIDDFVRKSYFGGRTEIFNPYFKGTKTKPLSEYDVNSLYPTVMRENEFPVSFLGWADKYDPNEMGFYHAEVDVPKNLYIPPLGLVHEVKSEKWDDKKKVWRQCKSEKFIFPVGRFQGYWSTAELEYAKTLGVKITWVGRGAIFKSGGKIFQKYVDTLYEMRKKAEKGSVEDITCKLAMNSLYGRMGLRRDRDILVLDDGQSGVEPYAEIKDDETGYVTRLCKQEKFLDKTFSNVDLL
jgi:hypothetical protein